MDDCLPVCATDGESVIVVAASEVIYRDVKDKIELNLKRFDDSCNNSVSQEISYFKYIIKLSEFMDE